MQQEHAQVHNIYAFHQQPLFTENEAYELVTLLLNITQKAKNRINGLNSQLEYHKAIAHEADALQIRINHEISKWSDKTRRLGAVPLSLFKVKIPSQEGYFIWEFPASKIEHHY